LLLEVIFFTSLTAFWHNTRFHAHTQCETSENSC